MCQRWETQYLVSSPSAWGDRSLGGLPCATSQIRRSKLKALSNSKQCSRRKSTRVSAGGVPCAVRLFAGRLLPRSSGDCFAQWCGPNSPGPCASCGRRRAHGPACEACRSVRRRHGGWRRSARTSQLSRCSSLLFGGTSTGEFPNSSRRHSTQ